MNVRHVNAFLILMLGMIGFISCDHKNNEKEVRQVENADILLSADSVNFADTDSMEIFLYPDPDEQKNYSVKKSSDSALVALVVNALEQEPVNANACAHYMKLYLFRGGQVFKTIYLSDSCSYLAYSINGGQIFKPLPEGLFNLLKRDK